jgi:hypothetical protein
VEGAVVTADKNLTSTNKSDNQEECVRNKHKKVYDAIHTVVLKKPRFHSMISSMRSCSQNTGPMTETKRLKLMVIVGIEIGSPEDNNNVD